MSQFAAGCAFCGLDLDQARREKADRASRRPSLPSFALPGVPDWVVTLGLLTLSTLFMPILGLLLTGLAIHRGTLTTQAPLRIGLWALLAAGVLLLFSPETRYGLIALLTTAG